MNNLFRRFNRAYNAGKKQDAFSIGLVSPLENVATSAIPIMEMHIERVQLVEKLGFFCDLLKGHALQSMSPLLGCWSNL